MRKVVRLALVVFALAAGAAGAASAGTGSWGPWEETYQGPISAPAGTVCAFPISAEPVREHLLLRYHYDETGSVDGYQVTGPIVARITNTATGESVQRNAASLGTVTFNPDGSWDAVIEGNLLVFFTGRDDPANQLLLLSGRTVLHGTPTGSKTLVSSSGRTENLCETLA